MRILLVEDEIKTAEYISKGLRENGFIVDIANNGEDGLFQALNLHYDIIILDVMLPIKDGFAIMQELRQAKPTSRVLFLTARDDIEDRVKGLELGADDYLIKPFAFSELLARVRSIMRRGIVQTADSLSLADLTIDIVKHKAFRSHLRLDLTPKEFALLVLLMQRKGEVLSRTLIAECVWDINFDSDTNVVDVAIRRLRQKIDDPFDKKLIHTIRGMGYLIEERE